MKPELPILECADQGQWRAWLDQHHATAQGAWLKLAKKGSGRQTVNHSEALEEALCYGWIDGQTRGLDEQFHLIRFTPRRPKSKWSQINRAHAKRLIEEGRMQAAGRAQVEAAMADGRWDAAYEPQSRATVPADFQEALDADAKAGRFFGTLRGAERYAFLYRLHHTAPAKRPERIKRYIELLGAGKTLQD